LAWFRGVAKTYPRRDADEILADLVASPPGEEGKWFAADYASCVSETRERVRQTVSRETFGERLVAQIIGRELGLR